MNIYLNLLVILLLFAVLETYGHLTEEQNRWAFYIMAIIMFCLLFFRSYTVGSDLGRYHTHFSTFGRVGIKEILSMKDLDNKAYYIYNSVFYKMTSGNYQAFISFTAILTFLPVVKMIKKVVGYSCTALYIYAGMGFYAFEFSGLKQAIAMGILCYALVGIVENNRFQFYICTVIASFFHLPAMIFIFAYEITHIRNSDIYLFITAVGAGILYIFREHAVLLLGDSYDSVIELIRTGSVGGKVLLIALVCIYGYIFYTPVYENEKSVYLFRLLIISAIIQTLAIYGNVFERLADYYFVYISIYLPLVFSVMLSEDKDIMVTKANRSVLFEVSIVVVLIAVFAYYWVYFKNTPGLLPYNTWL